MRVPYSWLKDYIKDLSVTAEEVGDRLTNAGIEVDAVEDFNPGIKKVVAGNIKKIESHPGKSNLSVVQVDTGEKDYRSIICGAGNVRVGQNVCVALTGAVLPGGKEIKEAEFMGIVSSGMICSSGELGLDLVQKEEGILELDDDVKPGTDICDYLEINDKVILLSLTPNRSDCLGLMGVAHELSAILGGDVKEPESDISESDEKAEELVSVAIEEKELCRRYTARVIKDMEISFSPLWMQVRLLKAGVRPISNIVDITNYVMWEYGQPLHAFDLSAVKDGAIIVRRARENEELVTIDSEKRKLSGDNLVIADPEKAVALAGVMGGENSEIVEDTKNVLLESAYFDPVITRRTARGLGLLSEASQRFEKGINPDGVVAAQNRAAFLMSKIAKGRVLKGIVDSYPLPFTPKKVLLNTDRAAKVLGIDIDGEAVESILNKLGFSYISSEEGKNLFEVTIPLRRPDIAIEEDLFEEVARLFGYDNIPVELPTGELLPSRESMEKRIDGVIEETLLACGFYEAITYSFVNRNFMDKFRLNSENDLCRLIELQNPISEDQSVLRSTLLPGLIEVLRYNLHFQESSQLFFEMGSVFIPEEIPIKKLPFEKPVLALAATGNVPEKNWNISSQQVDFFYLKGVLEALLQKISNASLEFKKDEFSFLHPGRSAAVHINGKYAGYMGELHSAVANSYDIKQRVILAEISLDILRDNTELFKSFKHLPRFPASLRDLAVIVPDNVSSSDVEACIKKVGGDVLEKLALFDVYQGEPVPENHRSLAYSMVYRSYEGTLKENDVSTVHEKIKKALYEELGVTLRH